MKLLATLFLIFVVTGPITYLMGWVIVRVVRRQYRIWRRVEAVRAS